MFVISRVIFAAPDIVRSWILWRVHRISDRIHPEEIQLLISCVKRCYRFLPPSLYLSFLKSHAVVYTFCLCFLLQTANKHFLTVHSSNYSMPLVSWQKVDFCTFHNFMSCWDRIGFCVLAEKSYALSSDSQRQRNSNIRFTSNKNTFRLYQKLYISDFQWKCFVQLHHWKIVYCSQSFSVAVIIQRIDLCE